MTDINYALSALGAVASQRATTSGHPAELAIDGNDLTYSGCPGATSVYAWWKVDLGAPQYITSVAILQQWTPQTLFLQGSSDDVNWDTIVQLDNPTANKDVLNVGGSTYRYWRLINQISGGSHPVNLYSAELWGPAEAPPPPTSPVCDYISSWLDGIEANYVPCVENWLASQ